VVSDKTNALMPYKPVRRRRSPLRSSAMGWEVYDGRRYYYRKRRVNGRVLSIYCGSGARGEAAAREDAERRQRKLVLPDAQPDARLTTSASTTDSAAPPGADLTYLSPGERAARVLARLEVNCGFEEAEERVARGVA
jgi:hypothetical protein